MRDVKMAFIKDTWSSTKNVYGKETLENDMWSDVETHMSRI